MTHEELSMNTKQRLCDSLKKLLKSKPFSKITVSELIADCNLNRKTFYYHFEDIYGLLKWMLEQEAIEVVKQFDLLVDYQAAICFVFDYVEENAYILNCIYDSVGREQLKHFFYQDFIVLMENLIKEIESQEHVILEEEYRFFLCSFYTEAIAGMLINLFQSPEFPERRTALHYLDILLHKSLPALMHTD